MKTLARFWHISTYAALVLVLLISKGTAQEIVKPSVTPLTNANNMTDAQDARSGIVRIWVGIPPYIDPRHRDGTECTATILKTSKITSDTWLLTAAHCFYRVDPHDYGVHDAGTTFDIQVQYGANLATTSEDAHTVHIHPDWASHVDGGSGIWYDYPDLAIIHFKAYVPVKNVDGLEYVEFSRPFFSGVMKTYEGRDSGVFGARGGLRWARGKFTMSTKGYVVIDGSDWKTEDAVIEHGDSGGPWLYTRGTQSTSDEYIMDGAILAVTSGGAPDRSPGSWPPVDFFAMGLSRPVVTDWIMRVTGDAVIVQDFLPWHRQSTVLVSTNGTTPWKRLMRTARNTGNVAVGEFGSHACDAGVPRQDLFLTEHGRWFVSWCGETDWESIGISSAEIGDDYGLAFGDFNGDGITDVFRASGGKWKVSYSGTNPWVEIGTSSAELTDKYGLAFGDFNGDGITDVFRASGGKWKVSYSGTNPWVEIGTSSAELTDKYGLAFGDFNGDGITDVFRASGGKWKVSYSGTNPWVEIATSNSKLTDKYGLLLGYFDSDSKVDVLRANGNTWSVSYGGTRPWTQLGTSSTVTRQLIVGDLNGDLRSDLLRVRPNTPCDNVLGSNYCNRLYYLNNTSPRR